MDSNPPWRDMKETGSKQPLPLSRSKRSLETGTSDAESPSSKRRRSSADSPSASDDADGDDGNTDKMTNWRRYICGVLGYQKTATDDDLRKGLWELGEAAVHGGEEVPEPPRVPDPFYKIIYRVSCSHAAAQPNQGNSPQLFEDRPILPSVDRNVSHLRGNKRITSMTRFIERHHGISFVVVLDFFCCKHGTPSDAERLKEIDESFIVGSEELCAALELLRPAGVPDEQQVVPRLATLKEHTHTRFWVYRRLNDLMSLPQRCQGLQKKHVLCFIDYFYKQKSSEHQRLAHLLERGEICHELLGYLFVPGDIVIIKSTRGEDHDRGYLLTGWPLYEHGSASRGGTQHIPHALSSEHTVATIETRFNLGSWEYDGNFMKHNTSYLAKFSKTPGEVVPITSLPWYPYQYASDHRKRELLNRGKMFWKCRRQKYVTYSGWDLDRLEHFSNSRFMIDWQSSQSLKRARVGEGIIPQFEDQLGESAMDRDGPPSDEFALMLPTALSGFNMQIKSWKQLSVACIRDVDWDEKAFDNLVIDVDTKDVIQSLVTHRTTNSQSTDLIRGKGSGLILLLHGPPGTGKTLTAESVAERAKKPLYRVTCGDIGTRPEEVERYLTQVLSLAKAWDCVVLLDEAEVFLQERSLTDMHRNALVSVFLRILEYYDGILILTSNRVGTFDEGFRSRIQLALHYPKLSQKSRRTIWENFVDRLEDDPIARREIDIEDLRTNLYELSRIDLNGREIRNAINVARPVALSRAKKLDFECLATVIKVQSRFDKYIKEMNGDMDHEDVARDEGRR